MLGSKLPDIELHDITRYFKTIEVNEEDKKIRPLIGEEHSALTAYLTLYMTQTPVFVLSGSGTGKTVLMDALNHLSNDDLCIEIRLGSDTAMFYSADQINNRKIIFFPELQKTVTNKPVLECMKDWAEGKNSTRDVTDIIATQREGHDVARTQTLHWKPFFVTGAIENKDVLKIINEEMLRRCVQLKTDMSRSQTRKVVQDKLQRYSNPFIIEVMQEEEINKLRQFTDNKILDYTAKSVFNPGAVFIEQVIPIEFPISRSYVDYLLAVISGVTLFYSTKRMKYKHKYIGTPSDIWMGWVIYGEQFFESCLKFPIIGKEVINLFKEMREEGIDALTEKQVKEELNKRGYLGSNIRATLLKLEANCFLISDEDTRIGDRSKSKSKVYELSPNVHDVASKIDMNILISNIKKKVMTDFPDIADDYIDKYCKDIEVIHPITGVTVNIVNTVNTNDDDIGEEEAPNEILTSAAISKLGKTKLGAPSSDTITHTTRPKNTKETKKATILGGNAKSVSFVNPNISKTITNKYGVTDEKWMQEYILLHPQMVEIFFINDYIDEWKKHSKLSEDELRERGKVLYDNIRKQE